MQAMKDSLLLDQAYLNLEKREYDLRKAVLAMMDKLGRCPECGHPPTRHCHRCALGAALGAEQHHCDSH